MPSPLNITCVLLLTPCPRDSPENVNVTWIYLWITAPFLINTYRCQAHPLRDKKRPTRPGLSAE